MAAIGTRLFTFFCGAFVGEDLFGNRYYELKTAPKQGRRKRWVIYKGIPEASKVPAIWHGWLHYTHDKPMRQEDAQRYPWQKIHLPNLTGTKYAHSPLKDGKRTPTVADYRPWVP